MLQKTFNAVCFENGVKYGGKKKVLSYYTEYFTPTNSPKNAIQIWAIMLIDARKKPCPVKLTD